MKKVQIFSPHIDDALLSLGGSIINWRLKDYEIIVRNVFTITNWTHSKPLSEIHYSEEIDEISTLRKNEEREIAKKLNFTTEFWDFLDMPLRKNFSYYDYQKMQNKIENRIVKCLNPNDCFFFPLGVDHPDHLLLKSLSNKFVKDEYQIYFYEDLPYYSWAKFDYCKVGLELRKDKVPLLQKIDFKKKEDIIKEYKSQITESFIRDIKAYSYSILNGAFYERYWKQM